MLCSCMNTGQLPRMNEDVVSIQPDIGYEEIIRNPLLLKYASRDRQNDASLILKTITNNGLLIRHASSRLQADIAIASAAVGQNGYAIKYISPEIKYHHRKKLVLLALENIKEKGNILTLDDITELIPHEMFRDRDVTMKVVEHNGLALGTILMEQPPLLDHDIEDNNNNNDDDDDTFIIEKPNEDKALIINALNQNGLALKYVTSPLMKFDLDVILTSVNQNGLALQFVCDTLFDYRSVVLAAVTQCGESLKYVSSVSELKNDFEIVLSAVQQCGMSLRYASQELRNSYVIVLEAVKSYGQALQYASIELRNNVEIVMHSVGNDYVSFRFASQLLQREGLHTHIMLLKDRYSVSVPVFLSTVLFASSSCYNTRSCPTTLCSCIQEDTLLKYSFNISENSLTSSSSSSLTLLNKLGVYSGLDVKKQIAEYAGVQIGEKWDLIRKVVWYLEFLQREYSTRYDHFSSEELAFLSEI